MLEFNMFKLSGMCHEHSSVLIIQSWNKHLLLLVLISCSQEKKKDNQNDQLRPVDKIEPLDPEEIEYQESLNLDVKV